MNSELSVDNTDGKELAEGESLGRSVGRRRRKRSISGFRNGRDRRTTLQLLYAGYHV